MIIHGSTRPCNCVTFTEDGDCFASVSQDAGVRIFSSSTLALMQQFMVPSCHTLCWTKDGESLFAASLVEGVMVIRPWTRDVIHLSIGTEYCYTELMGLDELNGRLVLVTHSSVDQQKIYRLSVFHVDIDALAERKDGDTVQAQFLQSTIMHCTPTSLVVSKTGETVFVGTNYGDVLVYNTGDLDQGPRELDRPMDGRGMTGREIKGMSLTQDGSVLVVPCRNSNVTLYNATTGDSIFKYNTRFAPNCAGLHPCQPQVKLYFYAGGQVAEEVTTTASGQEQFNVYFRDIVFNTELGSLPGPIGPVLTGSWDPTGTLLVVAAQDGVIYTWRFPKEIYQYRPQSDE